ncbi:Uncharacterised protein [Vibrio cholerae]|nr:Uncharacterised protein [Vibrio cholerae]
MSLFNVAPLLLLIKVCAALLSSRSVFCAVKAWDCRFGQPRLAQLTA